MDFLKKKSLGVGGFLKVRNQGVRESVDLIPNQSTPGLWSLGH